MHRCPGPSDPAFSVPLEQARRLAPLLAERADAIDRARQVPPDVIDALRGAGALRMLTPKRYGGLDLPMPEVLTVIELLSAADASVGWTVAQHAVAQLVLRHFPAATLAEVYRGGPDLLAAGAVAPKGRTELVPATGSEPDAWRVSGQWPFVTGAPQATWFYLQCLEVADRQPRMSESGLPLMRLVLLPATAVSIVDTWETLGLRGTASHDVRVSRASCAADWTCRFSQPPDPADALLAIPARDIGGLFVAAVVVGIAAGAIEDAVHVAVQGKRPAFSTQRLADSAAFQERLGEAYLRMRCARSVLHAETERAWQRAGDGEPMTQLDHAALRAIGPRVIAESMSAIDAAYALAGGGAVYDRSPLQRRFRDAHTAGQHFSAGSHFYPAVGATLVGGAASGLLL